MSVVWLCGENAIRRDKLAISVIRVFAPVEMCERLKRGPESVRFMAGHKAKPLGGDMKTKAFRVREGEKVSLRKRPTKIGDLYSSKDDYEDQLKAHVRELSELQELLYASNCYSLLLIFQAMDAAGKDGAIQHVMSGVNPQGCQVFSFKQPSAEELDHDFLWRCYKCLPERGRIGIFNRSYYEEVLVVRVHPEFLSAQNLPQEHSDMKALWKGRYASIVDMENHLFRSGTRVAKFFLHVSKDEQRERFLARIDEPEKNWKFNAGDVEERKHWDEYMRAYEKCLSATSTKNAPWYVVPADDKKNARLIVSEIVRQTLRELPMEFPKVDKARLEELKAFRATLSEPGA
ncbi:MAG: PPK2 family polyphosphate--nucleotide phosphotransferase [Candidatus Hydrogenedentota bacterium]